MIRGVYTAASAMVAQEYAQSVVANNLANVNTPGYKADVGVFESYRLAALATKGDAEVGRIIGEMGGGTLPVEFSLDLTDGVLKTTGNGLDAAARGNQFFVVRTAQGDRLTKAGEFAIGTDGTLVDTAGNSVVGRDGRTIRVDTRQTPKIDELGRVLVGNDVAGELRIVELLPGAQPKKEGGRLMQVNDAAIRDVANPKLVAGALEGSNVTVIEEMVGMIKAMRAYEAAQKALQSEDESLGRAVNEVAKP